MGNSLFSFCVLYQLGQLWETKSGSLELLRVFFRKSFDGFVGSIVEVLDLLHMGCSLSGHRIKAEVNLLSTVIVKLYLVGF